MDSTKMGNVKNIPILGQLPEIDINEWAVLISYSNKYLAKPAGIFTSTKLFVHDCMMKNIPILCSEAFDFMTPLRPMQPEPGQIGYTKDPVVSALDFTLEQVPLIVVVTSAYFCEDMQEEDKNTYKKFVTACVAQAKAYRVTRSPITQ